MCLDRHRAPAGDVPDDADARIDSMRANRLEPMAAGAPRWLFTVRPDEPTPMADANARGHREARAEHRELILQEDRLARDVAVETHSPAPFAADAAPRRHISRIEGGSVSPVRTPR